MGQRLLRKNGFQRDRNGGNLPRSLVPLIEVEEGVGEINDVLMAVDFRHSGKSEEELRVEEY